MPGIEQTIKDMCQRAVQAAYRLNTASTETKNQALLILADLIKSHNESILTANLLDVEAARKSGMASAMLDRLTLTPQILEEMAAGLLEVAALPDPVGKVEEMSPRPNGLMVGRMRIPLGVIGFIYESRPNVTVDAAALCLKSGNAVVLKGGKEAINSNLFLAELITQALKQAGLPEATVTVIPFTDRQATLCLLKQNNTLDVVIPRGGEGLVRFVAENATVPVLKHYEGVCHIYIDKNADLDMAARICENAKVQRPSACNALETILIHQDEAARMLPLLDKALSQVEIRACAKSITYIKRAHPATPDDWGREFLDLIVAIKIVEDMPEALEHIARYSSKHSEAIITNDYDRAHTFTRQVDSSVVLVNASTRFNDGGQLGLGAEIGISTSKLHAFGPMGLNELTTRKFVVLGNGQTRK